MHTPKIWPSLALLCLITTTTRAGQFGLFTYEVVGNTIEITDYQDDGTGHVDIPLEIEGKPVTAIEGTGAGMTRQGAFQGSGITSVSIPDSVTVLGEACFAICFGLESVVIPDSVITVGDSAFYQSNGLTSIIIGNKVETIGALAFFRCFRIESLVIPGRVTSITDRAFSGCSSMTSLSLGSGLTSIGPSAFAECSSLTSVEIPDSVTSIENLAFYRCTSITSASVGSGMTSLGTNTFSDCTSLTSVSLGPNITVIGSGTFSDCESLSSITIPDGVVAIEGNAFDGCDSLFSVVIPAGVTTIESFAFRRCGSLSIALFLGDAPSTFGVRVFEDAAAEFEFCFIPGSSGFTEPTWQDFPSKALVTTPTEPEVWLLNNGYPMDTNLNDDPNGDGVNLLMAFALNLNPNLNLAGSLPAPFLDGDTLNMRFYAARPEITYRVETSIDLKNWLTEGVTMSGPDVQRTASVVMDSPQRFLRLVVQQ
jgi:hypothetical protein